jgi:hypothetical protein
MCNGTVEALLEDRMFPAPKIALSVALLIIIEPLVFNPIELLWSAETTKKLLLKVTARVSEFVSAPVVSWFVVAYPWLRTYCVDASELIWFVFAYPCACTHCVDISQTLLLKVSVNPQSEFVESAI